MLQHGYFFEHLSDAATTVPREGLAAGGELRGTYACDVAEYFLSNCCSVEIHPSLGENLCPCPCCRNRSLGA